MRKRIYMDYASTTPLHPKVFQAMRPFFSARFGNPGAIHAEGFSAKRALAEGRARSARALGVRENEIVFTSGGTEANNLAIAGVIEAARRRGAPYERLHVVSTEIEHSSVREALKEFSRRGVRVSFLKPSPLGIVSAETVAAALTGETVLVSVMYANNEIGTIQPIREIAKALRARSAASLPAVSAAAPSAPAFRRPLFHTDACQAPLYLDVDPNHLGADLLSLDAHKMYGPKGVGALYARRGTGLAPILFGGGQERGLRPTTENVPGIVGFAEALSLAAAGREKESTRLARLRDRFFEKIFAAFPAAAANGSRAARLPNNVNVSLPGADPEFLVLKLDAAGIACSTKSSCLSGEEESYVVRALDPAGDRPRQTLRFTLGRETTAADIDRAVRALFSAAAGLSGGKRRSRVADFSAEKK